MRIIVALAFCFVAVNRAQSPGFVASQAIVDCGSRPATIEQTRSAMEACFAELNRKIGGVPLKALLVNDNLNQSATTIAETQKFAHDIPNAVISVEWRNPPSFSHDHLENYARSHRGIQMIAITGDIEVHLFEAPFLRPRLHDSKPGYSPNPDMRKETATLVDRYGLYGPKTRNLLFAWPSSGALEWPWNGVSVHRLGAIGHNGSVITPMANLTRFTPQQFICAINGHCFTNEPLAMLLIGEFNRNELNAGFEGSITNAGIQTPGFLTGFGDNLLINTFNDVGEIGIQVLDKARETEVFRISPDRDKAGLATRELDGYPITKVGPNGGRDVVATVADEILAPTESIKTYTLCDFTPGLGFRMKTKDGSITALVCLGCGEIEYTVRNRWGKQLKSDLRQFRDEITWQSFAAIGLKHFPGDPELTEAIRQRRKLMEHSQPFVTNNAQNGF